MTTEPTDPVGEYPELSPLEQCLRRAENGAPELSAAPPASAAADTPPPSPSGGGAGHVETHPPDVSVAGPSTTVGVVTEIDGLRAEIERLKTRDADNTATITRLSTENKTLTDALAEIHTRAATHVGRRHQPPARPGNGPPTVGLLSGLAKALLTQRGGGR